MILVLARPSEHDVSRYGREWRCDKVSVLPARDGNGLLLWVSFFFPPRVAGLCCDLP